MNLTFVHGYYLNEQYFEMSRFNIQVDAERTGRMLLEVAKQADWPSHLRPKLSSLFLETAERNRVELDRTLREQGVAKNSEVRLRLAVR